MMIFERTTLIAIAILIAFALFNAVAVAFLNSFLI